MNGLKKSFELSSDFRNEKLLNGNDAKTHADRKSIFIMISCVKAYFQITL
jgi:hypothetical protein